ncbi:TlyA family RNA methyltransferase [Luteipulveratus halotolerans]|uniref:TlyA family RNA methyltransferase n=1 Tax=Luteipulveratus halotolerans TaxID=1631356 RepID=UPI0022B140B9|nr:TlyA family RNA methyltransferase [Luteipulveratus halotolerans]
MGRAAYKLLGALETFAGLAEAIPGARCIDVGASTGGFTQVLLSRDASTVLALDVGHDQLVDEIAHDPRVTDLPGTNVRDIDVDALGGPADVVVADLSFISLPLVIARLADLTSTDGHLMVLVKPQFEVGRDALARTGVVQSAQLRARSVSGVVDAARRQGLVPHGLAPSPVAGGTGNREYLLWLRHSTAGMMAAMDLNAALEQIARGES